MIRRLLLSVPLLTGACIDAGQASVAVPLELAGTALTGPVEARDGVPVTLSSAQLAFGPFALCAGSQAGELCETARLEWLESEVVEVLSPDPVDVGELTGLTGSVRSFMYDLGITSLLTQSDPLVLPAAKTLGDASLDLRGVADVGGPLPFRAHLVIAQSEDTEAGIPVVRSAPGALEAHEVTADEAGLLVRFDAAPWVADVDFLALVGDVPCEPDGPEITCLADEEQTCNTDGTVASVRDCSTEGERCVLGLGCVAELELDPEGQAGRSIGTQIVAGPAPEFSWASK